MRGPAIRVQPEKVRSERIDTTEPWSCGVTVIVSVLVTRFVPPR